MESAPIILIDDDTDDCELFRDACIELNIKNDLIIFHKTPDAFAYLSSMKENPLFIICDVNMPLMNGLELRQKINANEKLRLKAIPFLFWSTSGSKGLVNQAYSLNVQGFFTKPDSAKKFKKILSAIMNYWDCSDRPVN